MTNAAAFRATYADWKLIKTRSVVQVVFEVPLEQADLAYQVIGGMPDPGAERWCAIARLVDNMALRPRPPQAQGESQPADDSHRGQPHHEGGATKLNEGVTVAPDLPVEAAGSCGDTPDRPHTPRKVAPDKRMAQRAGRLCADTVFQQFLLERGSILSKCEPEAAEFIRQYCGVESRSELIPGEPAATVWTHLHSEFEAWRMM